MEWERERERREPKHRREEKKSDTLENEMQQQLHLLKLCKDAVAAVAVWMQLTH